MKEVITYHKYHVLIDDEWHEMLKYVSRIYTKTYIQPDGWEDTRAYVFKNTSLSRFIMDPIPKGYVVRHINGNNLDDRRENLVLVTKSVARGNKKFGRVRETLEGEQNVHS